MSAGGWTKNSILSGFSSTSKRCIQFVSFGEFESMIVPNEWYSGGSPSFGGFTGWKRPTREFAIQMRFQGIELPSLIHAPDGSNDLIARSSSSSSTSNGMNTKSVLHHVPSRWIDGTSMRPSSDGC